MYTLIKTTTRFAVVALGLLLTACVTDVYEPKPEPEPTPIPTPTPGGGDFDFSTVEETTLTVNVNDLYNGQFDYVVEVYYENPFDSKDAECKFKGIASAKKPLALTLVLPQALEQIYVMQIDPTTGRSVIPVTITAGTTALSCDFRPVKVPETMSTKSVLRADGDARELTGTDATKNIKLSDGENYIISGTVACKELILENGSTLTVKGILNADFISLNGKSDNILAGKMFILSDGVAKSTRFTIGAKANLSNKGKITVTGRFQTSEHATITNLCHMEIETYNSSKANLILGSSSLFKCNIFQLDNSNVTMNSHAILRATSAIFDNANNHITNEKGSDFALVDFVNVNCNGKGNVLNYKGNIHVISPNKSGDGHYKILQGAQVVDRNASIEIPAGGCTDEGNMVPDKPEPSNPNYPIEIPNGGDYTFAMEDNWPSLGDYDMNDLVLGMNIKLTAGGNGITGMVMQITLRAVGATKTLGAGLQFENVSSDKITSAVGGNLPVNGYFNLDGNGVESGVKAVLPLFDNAHGLLGVANGQITNTYKYDAGIKTLSYYIDFTSPVPQADLVITKLNFFIVNGGDSNQRSEVHLAGYAPTAKVKGDTKNYVSEDGMVWGIMIPTVFQYPKEGIRITDAYNGFAAWSQSGGKSNEDWYNSPTESEVLPIYEDENVGK